MGPLLALALAASPATSQQARVLTHRSIVEYDAGDFEKALADQTRAYELDPLPALLYNLGQCHRALQHWDRAAFFYRRYLARAPQARNRPQVEQLLALVVDRSNAAQLHAVPLVPARRDQAAHQAPGLLSTDSDLAPVVVVRGDSAPAQASPWAGRALGLAAGLAALGAGAAVVADLNGQAAMGMARPVPMASEWQLNQRVGRSVGFGIAADALLIGAGASLVTSGLLFALRSPSGSVALGPSGPGLALAGTF
ncbi:MAG: tetratricopeptide repeat protein [Deltaproteobacteria bacterium]